MEPKFAQVLEQVCKEAGAGGGGSGDGAAAAAPAGPPEQQQRELPRITASRGELLAMPVSCGTQSCCCNVYMC
jgi:hypothetical protein